MQTTQCTADHMQIKGARTAVTAHPRSFSRTLVLSSQRHAVVSSAPPGTARRTTTHDAAHGVTSIGPLPSLLSPMNLIHLAPDAAQCYR
jgi:hypothetical protein